MTSLIDEIKKYSGRKADFGLSSSKQVKIFGHHYCHLKFSFFLIAPSIQNFHVCDEK